MWILKVRFLLLKHRAWKPRNRSIPSRDKFFSLSKMFRPALWPTPGIKRRRRETDRSAPSRMSENIPSFPYLPTRRAQGHLSLTFTVPLRMCGRSGVCVCVCVSVLISNACSRNHELLNYRTDLFKIDVFRELMIRHWRQSPLFLLISSQNILFHEKSKR